MAEEPLWDDCQSLAQPSASRVTSRCLPCPGGGARGSHMSLMEPAVLPKAGHLISIPSRFWGEGTLSTMDMRLRIYSTVVPSQFIPASCSHRPSTRRGLLMQPENVGKN